MSARISSYQGSSAAIIEEKKRKFDSDLQDIERRILGH